jgi:hypothetical protein
LAYMENDAREGEYRKQHKKFALTSSVGAGKIAANVTKHRINN